MKSKGKESHGRLGRLEGQDVGAKQQERREHQAIQADRMHRPGKKGRKSLTMIVIDGRVNVKCEIGREETRIKSPRGFGMKCEERESNAKKGRRSGDRRMDPNANGRMR